MLLSFDKRHSLMLRCSYDGSRLVTLTILMTNSSFEKARTSIEARLRWTTSMSIGRGGIR